MPDDEARSRAGEVVVVVAARDEAPRLGATLGALSCALPRSQLWVADDGSRDATASIARAAGAQVVGGGAPQGKGAAMTRAAGAALAGLGDARGPGDGAGARAGTGTVFLLCDGDLGDCAGELAALVRAVQAGAADLAVAAFERRSGGGFGLAQAFARWAIRARCGVRTSSPVCGQRALGADALAGLLPFADGWGMELAMTIDAARAGLRVHEIELPLEHRASGRTPAGFAHRARQLADFVRVYRTRAHPARSAAPRAGARSE